MTEAPRGQCHCGTLVFELRLSDGVNHPTDTGRPRTARRLLHISEGSEA